MYLLMIVLVGVLFILRLMSFTGLKQRTEIVPQKGGAGCSNVYLGGLNCSYGLNFLARSVYRLKRHQTSFRLLNGFD